MSNPYRNALAELVRRWYAASGDQDLLDVAADAMDHARTLLDQLEPPELTDEKLLRLAAEVFGYLFLDGGIGGGESEFLAYARAAIAADCARRPTLQPEPPTPISAHDLAIQCNRQADQSEQWDSLELYEQLAFAQARAITADRARRHP